MGRVDAAQLPAVPGRQQSVLLVGWVRGFGVGRSESYCIESIVIVPLALY